MRRISSLIVMFLMTACLFYTTSTAQSNIDFGFDEFSYSGKSLDISERTNQNARANQWHPDGTILYLAARDSENVLAFKTLEPWEIEGAILIAEFDLKGEMSYTDPPIGAMSDGSHTHGLFFRDNGEMMYILNRSEIWAYSLSSAWDITTAERSGYSALTEKLEVDLYGHGITFKPDGTILYVDDRDNETIFSFGLSTPWDVSTASFKNELDISDQEERIRDIEFIYDGQVLITMDTNRDTGSLLQYHLSEPYDITTAVFIDSFTLRGEVFNPRGLSISRDLNSFFITCRQEERIFQYDRGATKVVSVSDQPLWDFGPAPKDNVVADFTRFRADSYYDTNDWSTGYESKDGGFFHIDPGNSGTVDEAFGMFVEFSDLGNGSQNDFKVEAILSQTKTAHWQYYGIYALVDDPTDFVTSGSQNKEGVIYENNDSTVKNPERLRQVPGGSSLAEASQIHNFSPDFWYRMEIVGTYVDNGDLQLDLSMTQLDRDSLEPTDAGGAKDSSSVMKVLIEADDDGFPDGSWFGFGGRQLGGDGMHVHSFSVTSIP